MEIIVNKCDCIFPRIIEKIRAIDQILWIGFRILIKQEMKVPNYSF
jgi:hypothetical protein